MKYFRRLHALLRAPKKTLVLVLFLIACKEDSSLTSVCTDPIGTQDVTMKNNTQFCFKEGLNGCFITTLNATTLTFSVYPISGKQPANIVDIGPVKCLGQVNKKPTTGYSSSVNVVAGHGYVVLLPDNTYGRCYVASVSSSGGAPLLYVSWQYAF
ncbi:MAG TPA: hypothetical protein PLX35_00285 [Cyclobacteriaceae bacterium]|nr:hypothetical protein [Cyclobacteriaceae bacterium]